jgi:hypothetical protein
VIAVDAGSNQVSVLRIRPGGSLRLVSHGVVSSGGLLPDSVAVSGDRVYLANSGAGGSSYADFRLRPDGRLAGSLYPLWDLHGHYSEGPRWLARVLAEGDPLPAGVRARALLGSATLAVVQSDLEQAAAVCEEAAMLCRQAGDPAGLVHALQYMGLGAIFADDLGSAVALLEESLINARAAADRWLEAWALIFLAAAAMARGAYDEAAALASDCQAVLVPDGDPECMAWALAAEAMANLSSGAKPMQSRRSGRPSAASGIWVPCGGCPSPCSSPPSQPGRVATRRPRRLCSALPSTCGHRSGLASSPSWRYGSTPPSPRGRPRSGRKPSTVPGKPGRACRSTPLSPKPCGNSTLPPQHAHP